MDIGEMQKRLSLKAEQQPDHRFDDLFSLICREDWLMLAHDHVAGNAGSQTAGCDGINLRVFDEDLGDNLKELRESLEEGTFRPSPVRRVFIPKSGGRLRPLGIPICRSYCTSFQKGWGLSNGGPVPPSALFSFLRPIAATTSDESACASRR